MNEIPLDFEHADLGATLINSYRFDAPTMSVWEGVTQYLTETTMRGLFGVLANAPTGSRLAFSYSCQGFLDGIDYHGSPQTKAPPVEAPKRSSRSWWSTLAANCNI